jgi:mannose-6-phosphate isomerase-like protein (cupin superfamily)
MLQVFAMSMNERTLGNPATAESIRILESTSEAAGEHFHPTQEQTVSVFSGEMHLRINGEHRIVRAGQSATVPAGVRHFQWNPCDSELEAIEELRPAGRVHDFFRVLFGLAQDGRTDAKGNPPVLMAVLMFSEFKDSIRLEPVGLRFLVGALAPIASGLGYRRRIDEYLNGGRPNQR